MLKNPKIRWKWMKIASIDSEIVHIFWTTWGNCMKFSGKMCLKIMLNICQWWVNLYQETTVHKYFLSFSSNWISCKFSREPMVFFRKTILQKTSRFLYKLLGFELVETATGGVL